jgi:hypothetical protein
VSHATTEAQIHDESDHGGIMKDDLTSVKKLFPVGEVSGAGQGAYLAGTLNPFITLRA